MLKKPVIRIAITVINNQKRTATKQQTLYFPQQTLPVLPLLMRSGKKYYPKRFTKFQGKKEQSGHLPENTMTTKTRVLIIAPLVATPFLPVMENLKAVAAGPVFLNPLLKEALFMLPTILMV